MRADFKVVLDACVLAPASLCELLMRLAERPRLYSPRWGPEILDEVRRTQVEKLGFPEDLADYWRSEVERSFPEAIVPNAHLLECACENDEKDRHVLAVAIRSGAEVIVTTNGKHFPAKALAPWNVKARHPSDFLITLFTMESGVVVSKLTSIASDRGITPQEYLAKLAKVVPAFADYVAAELDWVLG